MLARHYKRDYKLICVADAHYLPQIRGVEAYPLWDAPECVGEQYHGRPNCYNRLRLFSPWAQHFGDRLISIDLDTIILGDITDLFDDQLFKVNAGFAAPYNGAMWQVRPGEVKDLWAMLDRSSVRVARRSRNEQGCRWIGSDQVFMSQYLPGATTWGPEDGVYHHTRTKVVPDDCRMLFFAGSQKPWDSRHRALYYEQSGI